ncbi:DUF1294 domain-containing protein [Vibrio parahaemolyticus]|nr:DUF1294 domain-containing protein [Vibrio parahaemolyticus]KJR22415.1 membrane protein [Vibrio parahaemolyticus]MBE3937359.1 DUF1294 domain-containing protein [Vibrio parahaemolyticus]MBE4295980.1 DUF1294 domain-containing protein [Vibrio parahaemolyticus]MBE4318508.1 DUF1294 domain-containing protein [Vibrio parahaemolyticus]
MKGKVVEWNDSKGYGFISALNGELRVFVHISTVQSKGRRPKVDDAVKFEVNEDKKGCYNATNVTILGSSPVSSTIMFSIVYLVLASTAVFILGGEKLFIAAYILMSIVTYVMYAIDKNAAQKGKWRTSENTLHLLSLLGGWMGALYAQNQLRHKSKKQPFKSILWLTIFVNIGAFVWTFTPSGSVFVQNFVSNWFLH